LGWFDEIRRTGAGGPGNASRAGDGGEPERRERPNTPPASDWSTLHRGLPRPETPEGPDRFPRNVTSGFQRNIPTFPMVMLGPNPNAQGFSFTVPVCIPASFVRAPVRSPNV